MPLTSTEPPVIENSLVASFEESSGSSRSDVETAVSEELLNDFDEEDPLLPELDFAHPKSNAARSIESINEMIFLVVFILISPFEFFGGLSPSDINYIH